MSRNGSNNGPPRSKRPRIVNDVRHTNEVTENDDQIPGPSAEVYDDREFAPLPFHDSGYGTQTNEQAIPDPSDDNALNPQRNEILLKNGNTLSYAVIAQPAYHSRLYNARGTNYKIRIIQKIEQSYGQIHRELAEMFEMIFNNCVRSANLRPKDLVRIAVISDQLNYPINTSYQQRREVSARWMADYIGDKLQSFETLVVNNRFELSIQVVKPDQGHAVRFANTGLAIDMRVKKSRAVFTGIDPALSHLPCFLVALSIATHAEGGKQHGQGKFRAVMRREGFVEKCVKKYIADANLPADYKTTTHEDYETFQKLIHPHRLYVMRSNSNGEMLYAPPLDEEGPCEPNGQRVCIMLHNNSFFPIVSVSLWFQKVAYCFTCRKTVGAKHKLNHLPDSKGAKCTACNETTCRSPRFHAPIRCAHCKGTFKNAKCFENHNAGGLCSLDNLCTDCNRWIPNRKDSKHDCSQRYCHYCSKYKDVDHVCYMIRYEPKQRGIGRIVYFDFESIQVRKSSSQSDALVHEVNYCVAMAHCDRCDDPTVKECLPCQQVFTFSALDGRNALADFCEWAFFEDINNETTFIAHNGRGYDFHFILNHLISNNHAPKLVVKGNQIIMLKYNNRRFVDSLSFLPMPLAAFPKAFGLDAGLSKGMFPHGWNVPEHYGTQLPCLPPIDYYGIETMRDEDMGRLLGWYEENKHKRFDFNKEIDRYCKMDVEILKQGCTKFKKIFKQYTGLNAFQSCTIASAVMGVYRKLYVPENTIGLIPVSEYRTRKRYSNVAMTWLTWCQRTVPGIRHAWSTGGEVRLPCGLYPDGCDLENKIVYNFMGCAYHGCPKCYHRQRDWLPLIKCSAGDARNANAVLKSRVVDDGYTVIDMWECEWRKAIADDPEKLAHVDSLDFSIEPLKIRDSLYGGRTEPFRVRARGTTQRPIRYVDVTSLYPYVCREGEFPVGHPERLVGPALHAKLEEKSNDISGMHGLIKLKILPPNDLHIPVLPYKYRGKLLFPLCARCAESNATDPCRCDDAERALVGTWVIPEVSRALDYGYRVVKIYEILWYPNSTKYDRATKKGGLMAEYMNNFMKLKLEASGYPQGVHTDAEKDQYVENIMKHEGIELDKENIEFNSGVRTFSKLCLNSLWGKFCERSEGLIEKKVVKDTKTFLDVLCSDKYEVNETIFFDNDVCLMYYKKKTGYCEPSKTSNVVIGSYVTAYGRMELYNYLNMVKERAVYCDTDSLIYQEEPGQPSPETSAYVGGLTNELGEEEYITEFVSCGPKSYSYRTNTGGESLKSKGFKVSHKVGKELTFDAMVAMIRKRREGSGVCIEIPDNDKFIRDMKALEVSTGKNLTKVFRAVLDKRVFPSNPDEYSLPFGHIGIENYNTVT